MLFKILLSLEDHFFDRMFGQAFLFLCFAIFAITYGVSINQGDQKTSNSTNEPKICTSEVCAKQSAAILRYLDRSVDPCDDFYEFACGKYLRETILPDDKTSDTSFTELQDEVNEQLATILMEDSQPNEPRAIQLSKQMMKMCLNETMLNDQGIAPLVEILERYGGWPVVKGDKWNADTWNWLDNRRQMHDDGFFTNFIMTFSVGPDYKDSSKNTISVS